MVVNKTAMGPFSAKIPKSLNYFLCNMNHKNFSSKRRTVHLGGSIYESYFLIKRKRIFSTPSILSVLFHLPSFYLFTSPSALSKMNRVLSRVSYNHPLHRDKVSIEHYIYKLHHHGCIATTSTEQYFIGLIE